MTSIPSKYERIADENSTIERRNPTVKNEKTDFEKFCNNSVRLHFACKILKNDM